MRFSASAVSLPRPESAYASGTVATASPPAAASTTTADGYTVAVSGEVAGMSHPLTIAFSENGESATHL